jgi:hypothetical protein
MGIDVESFMADGYVRIPGAVPQGVRLVGRAVDPCRPTSQGRDDRLIWRTRAPISMCGPADRMERSEPLAGVSRRPSAAPNVDPRTGMKSVRVPSRRSIHRSQRSRHYGRAALGFGLTRHPCSCRCGLTLVCRPAPRFTRHHWSGGVIGLPVRAGRPLTVPPSQRCVPPLDRFRGEGAAVTIIVETQRALTGGVDTHADVHMAAVIDPQGGLARRGVLSDRPRRLPDAQ